MVPSLKIRPSPQPAISQFEQLLADLEAAVSRAEEPAAQARHLQQCVLAGQLCLLAVRLILERQDVRAAAFTSDLLWTMELALSGKWSNQGAHVLALKSAVGEAFPEIGHLLDHAVQLPDDDLLQVGAWLLDVAPEEAVRAMPQWQRFGWTLPAERYDPLQPPLSRLMPRPTAVVGRQSLEAELQAVVADGTLAEQQAALLLMYLVARDQYECLSVVNQLDVLSRLLDAHLYLLRRARQPVGQVPRLIKLLSVVHVELGRPRLVLSRQRLRYPVDDLIELVGMTTRMLREVSLDTRHVPNARVEAGHDLLWRSFDQLDRRLTAGQTPETNEHLRLGLVLWSLLAVLLQDRAPGMQLPTVVQMAVSMSGIDPLWAWVEVQQLKGDQRALLLQAVRCALMTLEFMATVDDTPDAAEVNQLVRAFGGQLLAVARHVRLRLPDQLFIQQMFERYGVLSSLPLSAAQMEVGQARCVAMANQRRQALLVPPSAASPTHASIGVMEEASLFVEVHCSPVLDTSDVYVARALLRGAHVTLLGGHPTHGQRTALMDAFQLATLDWIGVDEYTHGLHAASRIHPETALVILAVRWMAHAHHGLRDVAKRRAVPVVMHPGGLNPRSVAYQVVRQASEQLRQHTSD